MTSRAVLELAVCEDGGNVVVVGEGLVKRAKELMDRSGAGREANEANVGESRGTSEKWLMVGLGPMDG